MDGESGDDVLIGLGGSDAMPAGKGHDMMVGGTEQGTPTATHVRRRRHDIAMWRAGDGSELRRRRQSTRSSWARRSRCEQHPVIITPTTGRYAKTGMPTADVTGKGGFCTVEDVAGSGSRIRVPRPLLRPKATGKLAVTIRVVEVEQVYLHERGRAARSPSPISPPATPAFVNLRSTRSGHINATVAKIILIADRRRREYSPPGLRPTP